MKFHRIVFAIVFVTLFADSVYACQRQGKIKWADDFQTFDPSWGQQSEPADLQKGKTTFDVSNGKAVLNVTAGHLTFRPNAAGIYTDDFTLCVKVTLDQNPKPPSDATDKDRISGGVLFWFVDKDNFYAFVIGPTGRAALIRKQSGAWIVPVNWASAGANVAGTMNELNILTIGDQISLFINDKLFAQTKGSKPNVGSLVGLYGQGTDADNAKIEVITFVITDVTKTQVK